MSAGPGRWGGQYSACRAHVRTSVKTISLTQKSMVWWYTSVTAAMWKDGPLQLTDQPPGRLVCSRINDSLCFKK